MVASDLVASKPVTGSPRTHEKFWERVLSTFSPANKGKTERESLVALKKTGRVASLRMRADSLAGVFNSNNKRTSFDGADDVEEEDGERPWKRNSFDEEAPRRSSFAVIVDGVVAAEKQKREALSALFARAGSQRGGIAQARRSRRSVPSVPQVTNVDEVMSEDDATLADEEYDVLEKKQPLHTVLPHELADVRTLVGLFEAALRRHAQERDVVLQQVSLATTKVMKRRDNAASSSSAAANNNNNNNNNIININNNNNNNNNNNKPVKRRDKVPSSEEEEDLVPMRDSKSERFLDALARSRPETMDHTPFGELAATKLDPMAVPLAPSFENVGIEARSLVVKIEASDPKHHLEYYHASQMDLANSSPKDTFEWLRVASNAVRLEIEARSGTHVFASRSVDADTGEVVSEVTTAVFEQDTQPEVVVSGLHMNKALTMRSGDQVRSCSVCAKEIPAGTAAYHCLDPAHDAAASPTVIRHGKALCGFTLCTTCTLAAFHHHPEELEEEEEPPSPPPNTPRGRPSASVALDLGARRLWLSEDVKFAGNTTKILGESCGLMDQIASLLSAEKSIKTVALQGHTNSKCGLECDGSNRCANNTCAHNFGATGGAVAFSLRRAEAVRQALVDRGVDPNRVTCQGLAGSRRTVHDTEDDKLNHLNRRVELHLDELQDPSATDDNDDDAPRKEEVEEEEEDEEEAPEKAPPAEAQDTEEGQVDLRLNSIVGIEDDALLLLA